MGLGPHAAFIVAAYAAAFALVAIVVVWLIADHRALRRMIADLEARGLVRRSSAKEAP
jgi:heme exporter protein D